MTDIDTMLNEVVGENETKANPDSDICVKTLQSLGYEVEASGSELSATKDGRSHSIFAVNRGQHESMFVIPVGTVDDGPMHVFNTSADIVAILHGDTIYRFKASDLRDTLGPIVSKLKDQQQFSMSKEEAIERKRLHVYYLAESDEYSINIHIPVDTLCNKLKYAEQKVS